MALTMQAFLAQTPDPQRQGLIQKITNRSLFMRILSFVHTPTGTYEYGFQTNLGGVTWRSLNEKWVASTGIVVPKVEKSGVFGGLVETDKLMVDGNPMARANQIAARVIRAGLFYDGAVINGDPTVDPRQFTGLKSRLTGAQLLDCGANGGNLSIAKVEALIDAVVGTNKEKVLVMCKADRRALKALVLAAAGGAQVLDVNSDLEKFDGCTIEVIDEDGDDTPIISKSEVMGSSGAVCSSIYCIRLGGSTDGEYVQGIGQTGMINTYPSGMQANMAQDVVEAFMGLAVFHGRAAARLQGIL